MRKLTFFLSFLSLTCSVVSTFAQATYTAGSGTTSNSSSTYPSPYGTYTGPAKQQFLVRASELTAQGAVAGYITSIAFNVTNLNACGAQNGFTLGLKNTTATALTTTFQTGVTTKWGPLNYNPVTGWNTYTFSTPFCWDGTSNILVEVCMTNSTWTNNASCQWSTLGFNASSYDYNDPTACSATSATSTSTSRPNIKFTISPPLPDLAAVGVVSPPYIAKLNQSYPITMTIQNNGCGGNITSANLGYSWNGGAAVTAPWTGSLIPGATANYTFPGNITPAATGVSVLKVWGKSPNGTTPDFNPANDTLKYLVYVNDSVVYDSLSYNGKNIWLAYMKNYDNNAGGGSTVFQLLLYIASLNPATVTVSAPLLQAAPIATLTMTANSVQSVNIPLTIGGSAMATANDEVVMNTGINIKASSSVSAFGLNNMTNSTDGFLAIPNGGLGLQYIAVAPIGIWNTGGALGAAGVNAPSEFVVLATQNATTVTITPSAATRTKTANTPFTVTLNAGQTYMLTGKITPNTTSPSGNNDLTGSFISANKPIAVFGGSQCAEVPFLGTTGTCAACNHIVEAFPPISSWGKSYYICDYAVKTVPDLVRIVSSFTGTTNINYNGTPITLTGRGAYTDVGLPDNSGASITSDQPIYVVQFSKGSACDGTNSDPMYIGMIPQGQWGKYYPFATPIGSYFQNNNYINVVKQGITSNIAVDGVTIPASSFTQIGSTGFYYTKYPITVGTHIATGDNNFICYVYGFDNFDAYGYPASGASLNNIAVPIELSSFGAVKDNKNVLVKWTTATELNNDHFVVERAHEGTLFTPIGRVEGAGNSSSARNYSFIDPNPENGDNYYRLKQQDYDGKVSYSEIAVVTFAKNSTLFMNHIRPVPSRDKIYVSFNSDLSGDAHYSLTDIMGREVFSGNFSDIQSGRNEKEVDISAFEKGVYIIEIQKGNDKIQSKVVKY